MLQVSVHDCPLATTNMGQDMSRFNTHPAVVIWRCAPCFMAVGSIEVLPLVGGFIV
jgi:hypothetical protein